MSELSPETRALLQDGRGVLRPSADDRARVRSALAARLGAAAFVATQEASAAASKSLVGWQKLSALVAAGGVVVAGAALLVVQSSPAEDAIGTAPVRPPAVGTVVAQPAEAPLDTTERVEPPAAPDPLSSLPTSTVRKPSPADRLAEEVAILSKATSQLRAGRPGEGLRLLEEHRRKFPTGRLAEERRAARVQALCALGNRAEAEAELARLAESSPRSPHLARARRACGITP